MDRGYFFEKYGIDEEKFSVLKITWDELERIYEDYSGKQAAYDEAARFIAERLNKEKIVHSIKYRVKDKEHVIEKIIRKMSQAPGLEVTLGNYSAVITDLVGVRVLHLFKENWFEIHNYLVENWEFSAAPKANYKKGDPVALLDSYTQHGCDLNEHPSGYRSIHYHLKLRMKRRDYLAEVQVRTLFEEAWSEIDHHFRYGVNKDEAQAEPYLGVLNNITSNADALASYMNQMKAVENLDSRLRVRDIYRKVNMGE
ncbi:MAG: RelA/SpoT domain-containing protein [Clostridiales bacterium]|nr:RelA/SpoT domain-containing protein [Clostridiales bacterium]